MAHVSSEQAGEGARSSTGAAARPRGYTFSSRRRTEVKRFPTFGVGSARRGTHAARIQAEGSAVAFAHSFQVVERRRSDMVLSERPRGGRAAHHLLHELGGAPLLPRQQLDLLHHGPDARLQCLDLLKVGRPRYGDMLAVRLAGLHPAEAASRGRRQRLGGRHEIARRRISRLQRSPVRSPQHSLGAAQPGTLGTARDFPPSQQLHSTWVCARSPKLCLEIPLEYRSIWAFPYVLGVWW